MRELSLNVMDVVQNSITAQAGLIEVAMSQNSADHTLRIEIVDNGRGMDAETVERVQSPFYTTRTTRKVGLGVPFFKMSCEMTGGSFSISSQPGEGTRVEANYRTDHIDMTPVGDMNETILLLITCNPELDFRYTKELDGKALELDTRQLREVLGEDVPLNSPEVVQWIREFLSEQEGAL